VSAARPEARPLGARDHLLGLALCVAHVAVLVVASRDHAKSRDQSFYVDAAHQYGGWIRQLLDDPSAALERQAIDRAWSYNHEHPALMKTLFALSWLAQEKWTIFGARASLPYRFPGMLTAGLLVWLVYVFGARAAGRVAGLCAAGAFALLPRVFYHSQLDCFDVPITFFLTLTTYAYWRSLERPRWAVATGLAYGLSLATKHNAWLLPGVLGIHFLWVVWTERRARRRGEGRAVSLVPWWLFAMALLGPPIFVGSWPWLWHDTAERFSAYASFHLHHDYYNMEYFGRNYYRPPFPISYPFVMTAFTVPATTLALALAGLGLRLRGLLPPGLGEALARALPAGPGAATGPVRAWLAGHADPGRGAPLAAPGPDRRATDVLFFGALLEPLVVIALPSTPIFGGTKHWFPAYPFLSIFAGVAAARVIAAVAAAVRARARGPGLRAAPAVAGASAGLLLLAPAAIETAHSHPFGLSHYTMLAGGVPGAATHGMNRQFWGFTTGSVAAWLRERMPDGGTVWPCDTTWGAWRMMQQDGMLPENIRATGDLATADYVLVHHEKHFLEVDLQAWVAHGSVAPAHVLTYDGVPIISIYEHPRRRAQREAREARERRGAVRAPGP
jgi:4-amino-4-deoxy-L-arabinose transferase-like glycosyltransferase